MAGSQRTFTCHCGDTGWVFKDRDFYDNVRFYIPFFPRPVSIDLIFGALTLHLDFQKAVAVTMDDMDIESVRRDILEQTDLADRFPNWSASVNLTEILRVLLRESQENQDQLSAEKAEFARLEEVSAQFKRYYLWVILALGLPGNVASLLTFLHMRSLGSCVVYVGVLAVVDSLALLVKLTLSLLQQHDAVFTTAACKALLFLANSLVVYANWIVVALAAERLFAVCRPLALSVYWTRSRAAWGLAGVLLLSLLACTPVLVVSVPTEDGSSCMSDEQHRSTAEAWHWANVTLYGFLPCLSLLTFNVAIIVLLRKARRQQLQLSLSGKASGGRQRVAADGQRQASVILLVASFVLIVLTIPRCAMLLMQQMWFPGDLVLIARVRVLNQVTYALSDANHAINFYLYFISARHFRRRFLDLFRSTKNRLKRLSTRETVHQRVTDSDWTRFVVMANRPSSPRNLGGWQEVKQKTETF
ncbi:probable G-protein coupled receptor B0563.6 [Littorina saxatilis]|uniref:probable G-protein coupled receptor B0563.6 n=1 Tax=Littorina saxatilis TaxID=31220 RepID=UPI0038B4C622